MVEQVRHMTMGRQACGAYLNVMCVSIKPEAHAHPTNAYDPSPVYPLANNMPSHIITYPAYRSVPTALPCPFPEPVQRCACPSALSTTGSHLKPRLITTPDVCHARPLPRRLGVEFQKKPDDGKMKGIAFIKV